MVGAAIVGTINSSNSAKSAARAQSAAASQATQQQQAQQQQTDANIAAQQQQNNAAIAAQQQQNATNLAPYTQTGGAAANELGYLLGTGGSDTSGGTDGAAGSLAQPFDLSKFQENPDYQFTLQKGQLALNRAGAANGSFLSGAQSKALIDYNQGAASQQYQTALGNYNTNQSNLYSRLSGVAGTGANASGALNTANTGLTGTGVNAGTTLQNTQAGVGINTANQINQNTTGAGNTQAAGLVGSANAINQGISSVNNIAAGAAGLAMGGMGGVPGAGSYSSGLNPAGYKGGY